MSAPASPRRRCDSSVQIPTSSVRPSCGSRNIATAHGLAAGPPDEAEAVAEAVAQPAGVLVRDGGRVRRGRTRGAGRGGTPGTRRAATRPGASRSRARGRARRRGARRGVADHQLRARLDLEARRLQRARRARGRRRSTNSKRGLRPRRTELGLQPLERRREGSGVAGRLVRDRVVEVGERIRRMEEERERRDVNGVVLLARHGPHVGLEALRESGGAAAGIPPF